MPQSYMQLDKEIDRLTPYKYLDSLDTVRFRSPSRSISEGRWLHAYADFFLSLMMGEGIVVPNNQLIDSIPFIDVASQLIETARTSKKIHHLKLRARIFKANSAFEVAEQNFGNIGKVENNHEDRFVLSGWQHLDENIERRKKWAAIFKDKLPLPAYDSTFFYDDTEYEFAKKLYAVLSYFDSPEGEWNRYTDALPNRVIREREIQDIGYMDEKSQELIFKDLDESTIKILSGVVSVFGKLLANNVRIDRRSDIMNVLRIPETKKLNPKYFENIENPEIVEESALTIVDSIYNYSSGYGTRSDLISHTEKAGSSGSITPAVLGLAVLDRLTNRIERGDYVLQMPDGVISPHSVRWAKILENKEKMKTLLDERFSWGTFFQATIIEPDWRQSLYEYLTAFEKFRNSSGNSSQDFEKPYLGERLRHMYKSRHAISDQYIQIVDEEWRMALKGISGIEVENSNVQEKGSEKGHSNEVGAEIKGTIAHEASATASITPEASATTSVSLEVGANISSGKYGKQSELTQVGKNTKGEMATLLRVKELQEYYIEQTKIGNTIKGVIATFTENVT